MNKNVQNRYRPFKGWRHFTTTTRILQGIAFLCKLRLLLLTLHCAGTTKFKDDRKNEMNYRKIPKISPSMYKPLQIKAPQTHNAKNPPLNHPSKYKLPRGLVLGNCPQIQSKQSKNHKFPCNYRASLIDFETQISLHR